MDEEEFYSSEVIKIYQILLPSRKAWILFWTSFQHNIFSMQIALYILPEYKICLRKKAVDPPYIKA